MAEASSPSVGKSEQEKDLAYLDMAVAAQHLMQLSGEEDEKEDTNNDKNKNQKKTKKSDSENHQDQSEEVASSAKIRTTKQEESFLPKRQRRYRSIVHIYMATKPVNAIHRKKIRS